MRILVFGSVARGDCVPGSDADVLVIVSESDVHGPKAWVERGDRYRFGGVDCGVEVFCYTVAEIEARLAVGDRFIAEMIETGIELYARPPAG